MKNIKVLHFGFQCPWIISTIKTLEQYCDNNYQINMSQYKYWLLKTVFIQTVELIYLKVSAL